MIDHKDKEYRVKSNVPIYEFQENEDGSKERMTHAITLCGVLIIEKEVIVKKQSDCIIHYLCVKKGCEGLGYTSKILITAFKDKDIAKKIVHCVAQLPYQYDTDKGEYIIKLEQYKKSIDIFILRIL